MDPLAQQVIQIGFRKIEVPPNEEVEASISRTNLYGNRNATTGENVPVPKSNLNEVLNIAMWAPSYNGMEFFFSGFWTSPFGSNIEDEISC